MDCRWSSSPSRRTSILSPSAKAYPSVWQLLRASFRRRRAAEAHAPDVEHDGRLEVRPRLERGRRLHASRHRRLDHKPAAALTSGHCTRNCLWWRRPGGANPARRRPAGGTGHFLNELMEAGKAAVALRGGGTIDTNSQRITLDAPPPTPDPEAISQGLVVMQDNMPVTIGQVTNVTIGPQVPIGDATIMGKPGVLVTVSSQFGANTLKAHRSGGGSAQGLEADSREARHRRHIFASAGLIHRARARKSRARLGSRLCAYPRRPVCVPAQLEGCANLVLGDPAVLLAAIVVLAEFGQTLNTMTLGGFAGARRSGGRCHHRHREHHAAASPCEGRGKAPTTSPPSRGLDRDQRLDVGMAPSPSSSFSCRSSFTGGCRAASLDRWP